MNVIFGITNFEVLQFANLSQMLKILTYISDVDRLEVQNLLTSHGSFGDVLLSEERNTNILHYQNGNIFVLLSFLFSLKKVGTLKSII